MNQIHKIAIIGGTGKSGKYLIKQLIQEGFQFKLLLRNPANFTIKNPLVEIVEGNVKDYNTVYKLLEGCNAVISCLGLGIPPSEHTIFSQATTNILQAMKECQIDRYIIVTGLNVDTPTDKKGPHTKSATDWMYANYPVTTTDRQTEFDILNKSTVQWTLVRLPLIEQTDSLGEINSGLEDCPGDKISATSLAKFLIAQVSDTRYICQSPFIADK